MKKIILVVAAVVIFLVAASLLRPAPSTEVVIAATDLSVGQVITEADIQLQAVPADMVPADAILKTADAIGQPLRLDRGQGDMLRLSQLGSVAKLEPNERAIAVKISDASGLAGLLVPGQAVGIIALQNLQVTDTDGNDHSGAFSKAAIEGLRILYVDPLWAASRATTASSAASAEATPQANALVGGVQTNERTKEGTVILAVPTDLQTIVYDFSRTTGETATREVSALELLAALSNTDGAKLSLYLMPGEGAAQFTTPGLWMPDLAVMPQPTATPTATPFGAIQP
jgi:pilus assembly protein CpaB